MVTIQTFREMALALDGVTEQPHFEKSSFGVNQKIVATLDLQHNRVTLKLNEIDQSVFCAIDPAIIYPVAGTWGKQGWTILELSKVPHDLLADALHTAYTTVTAKRKMK